MMVGYIIRRSYGDLTNGGDWSDRSFNLFLTPTLSVAKKICKKHKGAIVVEVIGIETGKVVYRQK